MMLIINFILLNAFSAKSMKGEIRVFSSQSKGTLYEYFCGELFRNGILAWRVLQQNLHVVIMNGHHSETGNFQK